MQSAVSDDSSSKNSENNSDYGQQKTIRVRHPLRARSKSITLPNYKTVESKNFPISRLNNYDPVLKKHRGSIVSMQSSLQSIDEEEDLESARGADHSRTKKGEGSTEKAHTSSGDNKLHKLHCRASSGKLFVRRSHQQQAVA